MIVSAYRQLLSLHSTISRGMSRKIVPSHHAPSGGFRNPPEWASHKDVGPYEFFTQALPYWNFSTRYIPQPIEIPDFEALRKAQFAALWLGHCTFVLAVGRARILTDPFFSLRASPFSFAGPARFTRAPAAVVELPPIDAVVISHSHYDHLDAEAVRALLLLPLPPRIWVVPLGLDTLLKGLGVPASLIRVLDWWEDVTFTDADNTAIVITLVPAQHNSARTIWDKNQTLWGGFYVANSLKKIYYSGDTGYRAVGQNTIAASEEEDAAPRCPVFKEMRARLGAPDLALLPIGAYSPRGFMSTIHASPEDAVEIFQDVGAVTAIGCHFGTLPLTDERVDEPPERLARALARRGKAVNDFICLCNGGMWEERKV